MGKALSRLLGESGQSSWVNLGLQVGIGLFAAGIVYGFMSGSFQSFMQQAGTLLQGLMTQVKLP